MKKILVCGSRDWKDGGAIKARLLDFFDLHGPLLLIHGGARGADNLAGDIARRYGWREVVYKPDWSKGRHAGLLRNEEMLNDSKPDLVLAFWDGKSKGTAHMVATARRAHVPVEVIMPPPARGVLFS